MEVLRWASTCLQALASHERNGTSWGRVDMAPGLLQEQLQKQRQGHSAAAASQDEQQQQQRQGHSAAAAPQDEQPYWAIQAQKKRDRRHRAMLAQQQEHARVEQAILAALPPRRVLATMWSQFLQDYRAMQQSMQQQQQQQQRQFFQQLGTAPYQIQLPGQPFLEPMQPLLEPDQQLLGEPPRIMPPVLLAKQVQAPPRRGVLCIQEPRLITPRSFRPTVLHLQCIAGSAILRVGVSSSQLIGDPPSLCA
jgi:hypothetical protein